MFLKVTELNSAIQARRPFECKAHVLYQNMFICFNKLIDKINTVHQLKIRLKHIKRTI